MVSASRHFFQLLVRPEIRWDWSDRPEYNDHRDFNQLLLAVDAVVRF
jgi:hypothetical protein